ncbi:hypothetical protein NST62_12645 [Ureibacillus sp. FSL K6-8385]|uniref:Uncharacterized protein n=1 Tax=Ureibacillus terrenus TaxID=118246 RepID=A0A540V0V7_9BACL|nr:hypothetical protein [Ureibacillus terrenus]MED3662211.1 hypothetical protein [Ureibacillus terrenus]MED3765133.1 hypothetical protein [Ureibacillus terrenus]TQE90371.1 hypothetical protein FKZ59_09965 [Ureibacillus terrenus]
MLQKSEKKLTKMRYHYANQEYIILNKCPHCNLDIHPTVENRYRFENKNFHIFILSLTCPSCRKDYFVVNNCEKSVDDRNRYLFTIPHYSLQNETLIQNTSKKFQNLYSQSVQAEIQGHDDIAFFGYIKSLEVLVKDIAIIEHPDSEDIVLFSSLIQCLEKFHSTNIHLFSKRLLEVLKNDYLHYQKGPEFAKYTGLVKDCIDYFLLYLELLQKTLPINIHRREKEA